MSENTNLSLLNRIKSGENSAVGEFIACYTGFLEAMLKKGLIYGGFRVCTVLYPNNDKKTVIEKLKPLISGVCEDFVHQRLDRRFFEEYEKKLKMSFENPAVRKNSVRTILQYTFVNRLKKECIDSGVICAVRKNGDIELYSKDEMTGTEKIPMSRENLSSLLRRFRIMLTRLAGKGNISIYPAPYECYALKYGCLDRNAYIERFIPSPEQQENLKNKKILNETDVALILTKRYAGKKGVSCERRTINNRIREYRELLEITLLDYCPGLKNNAALVEKVLKTSGTVPEDELLMVFHELLQCFSSREQAESNMKTGTVVF